MVSASTDERTFARQVEEVLGHLFDHFYLQYHPFGGLLVPGATPALRGRALSRAVIDAIARLRPGPEVPASSLAWRKYRYLYLRYVEAVSLEQISRQLGVSDRQGRRDHRQAVDALITLLWDEYRALTAAKPRSEANNSVGGGRAEGIEDELLRIGNVAPRSACHLSDLVDGALATTGPLLQRAGTRISVRIPPDLPLVAVSPLILRQVIIGLVTHAVDLSQAGEIRIEAVEGSSSNKLTVSASGIPARGDADLLATSRRLAEMQGAQLELTTDPANQSLRLVLSLPVVERATVLVIDDDPDVVLLFRRYLGQTYRLVQATTADEALDLATAARPALVTLDVMMPGLDGWQVLDRLRSDPATSDIPVIVCSILREPSLATALGAVAYLPKPINPLALRSILDRHLALPGSAGRS